MAVLLGIDTGGTYTDAVLYDDAAGVVTATAKARTTHEQLDLGIGEAARAVLAAAAVAPETIDLASISTTLATNALVESKGGRVALVFIGFAAAELGRGGLAEALGDDPVIHVAGGHNSHGDARATLDLEALAPELAALAGEVDAFAVVAEFSVRNPEHELAVETLIGEVADRPVTCSHELSAKLNGPKRAVTTVLNARLIGLLEELMDAAQGVLEALGIGAPVMVVRGDGSLVSDEFARRRPIETILSGPAASVVGAAQLAIATTAVVSDIGGTTTDVAVVTDGRPTIDPHGATVGGHRTMVEAVAMHTHGLGGDSEVHADLRQMPGSIVLGPRRALPLAALAEDHGPAILAELDRQLLLDITPESAARFVIVSPRQVRHGDLDEAEQAMLVTVGASAQAVDRLARSRPEHRALQSLLRRNLLMMSTFTPTDAAHVLGLQSTWDPAASIRGATLLARLRGADGHPLAPDAAAFATCTIDALVRRSAEVVLEAALIDDDPRLAGHTASALAHASFERRLREPAAAPASRIDIGLGVPLVGLGASAPTYYPRVGALVGAVSEVPEHADVANAVGAVVGQVRIHRDALISQPNDGVFRTHVHDSPMDFSDLDDARRHAESELRSLLESQADAAGASTPRIEVTWDPTWVTANNAELFVEGRLTATAVARPRF